MQFQCISSSISSSVRQHWQPSSGSSIVTHYHTPGASFPPPHRISIRHCVCRAFIGLFASFPNTSSSTAYSMLAMGPFAEHSQPFTFIHWQGLLQESTCIHSNEIQIAIGTHRAEHQFGFRGSLGAIRPRQVGDIRRLPGTPFGRRGPGQVSFYDNPYVITVWARPQGHEAKGGIMATQGL